MATATPEQTFQFGGFTLDLRSGLLRRDDRETPLRPKAHAVLTHLARNIGRVVPKSEIMDTVWPEVYVTEDSLTQSIREIRKALGDDRQELVRTVSRRGYILDGGTDTGARIGSQPIVAVLRMRNETGDSGKAWLADGFSDDLINGLARFGTVTVLARNASFSVEDGSRDDHAAAATRLGAGYLISGAIRRISEGLRISVALIDATSQRHLWGERYDTADSSVFAIQQDIVDRVIGRLAARLDHEGLTSRARKPEADLEAWELNLRGLALLRTNDKSKFEEALLLFEAATLSDPRFSLAHAHLALTMVMIGGYGSAPPEVLTKALEIARHAIAIAPEQPVGHRVLSFIMMYQREHAAAEHHLRRSLELNPCDAESLDQLGYLLVLRGRPLEALAWLDRAVLLSPVYPNWYDFDRSLALYSLGDYGAAAAAIERWPSVPPWIRTRLAACFAMLGDVDTSRLHVARVNESDIDFSPVKYAQDGVCFEFATDTRHLCEGVFKALGRPMD